jgi:uncharacterized coiled-coil protein SlyX
VWMWGGGILQEANNTVPNWEWWGSLGVGGTIAGIIFTWMTQEIKRHKEEYKELVDRQQKLEERLLDVAAKQTQALNELSNVVQQWTNLNRIEDKIERLRDAQATERG